MRDVVEEPAPRSAPGTRGGPAPSGGADGVLHEHPRFVGWPRLADYDQTEDGWNAYLEAWMLRRRRAPFLSHIPMFAIEEHRGAIALGERNGWREFEHDAPTATPPKLRDTLIPAQHARGRPEQLVRCTGQTVP